MTTLKVDAGDECLTLAEDRVRLAIGVSLAWRQLINRPVPAELAWSAVPPRSEAEGLAAVRIDEIALPESGLAFTEAELRQRGTLASVQADFEDGYTILPGEGEGVVSLPLVQVLVLIEHPLSEAEVHQGWNWRRRVKLRVAQLMRESFDYLATQFGPRYASAVTLKQAPAPRQEEERGERPYRMQAALLYEIGTGGGGGD